MIISDTEIETEEEPGYITPEKKSQTMETTTGEISQTAIKQLYINRKDNIAVISNSCHLNEP